MFCKNLDDNNCTLNCQEGLKAIPKSHSTLIRLKKTRNIKGSVNLDHDLKTSYPNDSRWDYLVAYIVESEKLKLGKNILLFFEVHDLNSLSQLKLIFKKKEFVHTWLKSDKNCNKGLKLFSSEKEFYCIPTQGVNRKVAMALADKGIKIHKSPI